MLYSCVAFAIAEKIEYRYDGSVSEGLRNAGVGGSPNCGLETAPFEVCLLDPRAAYFRRPPMAPRTLRGLFNRVIPEIRGACLALSDSGRGLPHSKTWRNDSAPQAVALASWSAGLLSRCGRAHPVLERVVLCCLASSPHPRLIFMTPPGPESTQHFTAYGAVTRKKPVLPVLEMVVWKDPLASAVLVWSGRQEMTGVRLVASSSR